METFGLILANKQYHQEGVPSGLLSLGNGETSVIRLARQLRQACCEHLFCVVDPSDYNVFDEALQKADVPIIFVKTDLENNQPLRNLFNILPDPGSDWLCQVNGNAVFDENAISQMLGWADRTPAPASTMVVDYKQQSIHSISLSVATFASFLNEALDFDAAHQWGRKQGFCILSPHTIADVSTPEGFAKAQAHFSSPENVLLTPDNPHQ